MIDSSYIHIPPFGLYYSNNIAEIAAGATREEKMDWIKKCYSRMLIDNHITDLNPKFMSKFDPEQYVAMVRRAGVKSAMVYSCDHNGNCYYPTRV